MQRMTKAETPRGLPRDKGRTYPFRLSGKTRMVPPTAYACRVDQKSEEKPVAERVGFEPTIRLPVYRISSAAHSTTLPPLRMYRVRFRAQGPGRSEGAD